MKLHKFGRSLSPMLQFLGHPNYSVWTGLLQISDVGPLYLKVSEVTLTRSLLFIPMEKQGNTEAVFIDSSWKTILTSDPFTERLIFPFPTFTPRPITSPASHLVPIGRGFDFPSCQSSCRKPQIPQDPLVSPQPSPSLPFGLTLSNPQSVQSTKGTKAKLRASLLFHLHNLDFVVKHPII